MEKYFGGKLMLYNAHKNRSDTDTLFSPMIGSHAYSGKAAESVTHI
jgi:hypothetical protein